MKPLVAERVTSSIVVAAGMPAPSIGSPTSKPPAVTATEVTAVEPALTSPLPAAVISEVTVGEPAVRSPLAATALFSLT